eukprot:TRINITY_DN20836_c0_g1_i1.p1 TRINITY_DN20836_c0_g1~~TRINITY_DN20836_c0_g1_i1.p1  ORF type:complete len:282 (-),score=5.21 TRINITY_DN20836_c0_g1_i1:251-1096(-)
MGRSPGVHHFSTLPHRQSRRGTKIFTFLSMIAVEILYALNLWPVDGKILSRNREWRRTGWNSIDPRHFTTFYDLKQHREEISGNRKGYKHKIYCTSCQPSADIYHDCRMFMVRTQQYWYTERDGKHLLARDLSIGSPNWFQWRIVSQPPREYWIDAEEFNNCHGAVGENAPAHISFETSITNSVSHTFTVEQKISIGLDAVPLLKKLGETTVTWSTENIRTWANSRKITVGSAGTKSKMVKPGWKWVIQQFVGDASFTRIGTNKYRFCDVECSSNAACPSA